MTPRGKGLPLLVVLILVLTPALALLATVPAVDEITRSRWVPQHLVDPEPGTLGGVPGVESGPPILNRPLGTRATGTDPVIVLPIEFTDITHSATHNAAYFDSMMNAGSGQSVNAFYRENSYGTFGLQATIGSWVRSSRSMSYYGQDGSGVDDANGPIYRLVTEAVTLADASVNFANFDRDGDGVVDHVVVVHAGGAQESSSNTNLIWSHRWAVIDANPALPGDQSLRADGVQIYGYVMISEDSPFGVVAHEFGHDLGLPDLYDTDSSSLGVGEWDVMGSGSWNGNPRGTSPSHFGAWSKAQLGWLTPIDVTTPLLSQSIPAVENTSRAYRLTVKTASAGDEYFLVENRQRVGYDTALPGSGLLIWHVDDSVSNNDNDAHRLVDLEEHDQATNGDTPDDAGDPWVSDAIGFGPDTIPNSNGYGNVRTGWKVRNIGPSGPTMTADLSKDVDDDLAVTRVNGAFAVPVNQAVTITATLRNQGARDQTNVNVSLRVYRETMDPANEEPVANPIHLVPLLRSGAFDNQSWAFTPVSEARYVLDARVVLPLDEIPENNERVSHFVARNFSFRDDVESGAGSWTTPGQLITDQYRWQIVADTDPVGKSHSPIHAWRFGAYSGGLPTLTTYHYLESGTVNVPGGSLYLIYYQSYDLRGRETPVILNASDTDHGYVELSVAGGPWQTAAHFQGYDTRWKAVSLNLTSFVPTSPTTVQFRFNATSAVLLPTGGWWIDDIMLTDANYSYGVAVVPVVSGRVIEPGDEAVFTFKAVNVGDFDDTFRFSTAVPADWTAVMVVNASTILAVDAVRLTLAPDAEAALQLRARSPTGILRGTVVEIPLGVVSEGDGTKTADLTLTATINDPLGLGGIQKYLVWIIVLGIGLLVIIVLVDAAKHRKFRGHVR
ncbi:MAG TPA: M6 family metalloprotease domain-containing protein [Thermoplasmata archaeon]|nr:M6 family metalloprotease domain-containing protein [Thermoplasmata archaeon]